MKKYSADYFGKKFKILFNKLLLKEGFKDAVKEARKKLGIPDTGFDSEVKLAQFFIGKMSKRERFRLDLSTFIEAYEQKHKVVITEENGEEAVNAFVAEIKGNRTVDMLPMTVALGGNILNHHDMMTRMPIFKGNLYLSKLFPETMKLIRKFWGLDLLDEHIMAHFVERYLFLGENGVDQYIKIKIACPSCRYIGVDHFSPDRYNMEGRDEGPYSEKYIFNKETVKRLSMFFNSVFLIIKPYATKEETIQYIEDNWGWLKEHVIEKNTFYKQFDVHPNKIKQSNFERNQLVYELYRLPKKELLKNYRGGEQLSGRGIYKEAVIAKILLEEHQIDMSPDAIKKTATRFAKDTKAERQPKDIRDI